MGEGSTQTWGEKSTADEEPWRFRAEQQGGEAGVGGRARCQGMAVIIVITVTEPHCY